MAPLLWALHVFMKVEVIKKHQTNYPNPVSFKVGDKLTIGERDTEYKGWVKVTTSSGNFGWAPESYINLQSIPALATKNYTAKELNTEQGETLEFILSLNEWSWVKNSSREYGWVPNETIKHV